MIFVRLACQLANEPRIMETPYGPAPDGLYAFSLSLLHVSLTLSCYLPWRWSLYDLLNFGTGPQIHCMRDSVLWQSEMIFMKFRMLCSWGCAKGAEEASCGEMVVQNTKMDRNIFSMNSKVLRCFKCKPQEGREENGLSKKTLFWDCFPARQLPLL